MKRLPGPGGAYFDSGGDKENAKRASHIAARDGLQSRKVAGARQAVAATGAAIGRPFTPISSASFIAGQFRRASIISDGFRWAAYQRFQCCWSKPNVWPVMAIRASSTD
jgi:hypothetical protein